MKTTTVSKAKLIATITKHLEEHRVALRKSNTDYAEAKVKAKREFVAMLEETTRTPERAFQETFGKLTEPESHVKQYETYLAQLEWEESDSIELSADEFRPLVLNEWDWLGRFAHMSASNTRYLKGDK